jgi:hypothetical protein
MTSLFHRREPGSCQYSVWLRAGQPGDRHLIPVRGERIFPLACVQTGSGAHLPSCTMGTGGPFPERNTDHSPPFSAEIENEYEL